MKPHGGIVYPEERQQAIASQVISAGRASVAELAQTYEMSFAPINRVDVLITDPELSLTAHDELSQSGIEVVIARSV
jgi:DeoR/GlpR family transcriptional regulator of sugar metabolism